MMMTVNNGSGTGNNTQTVCYNMNAQTDSVSKNIQDQIANAQKQMQELSADKDMAPEDKMKKRQEIQQQITNLTQQLRQHQIEQRKEQQSKNISAKENNKNSQITDATKQEAGFSSAGMVAMLSADSSIKQAKVQGSVATQMEGKAAVLEIEIKQDGARGGDTSAKEAELAQAEQRAENATNAQLNTLAEANQTMAEADSTNNNTNMERADSKTDKTDYDGQQTGEISDRAKENAAINTSAQSSEGTAMVSNTSEETAAEESQPTAKKHIDIYL